MGHSKVTLAFSVIFIFCGFYTALHSLPFLGFLAFLFSSSFSFYQKSRHSVDSKENVSLHNEIAMKKEETQEEKREEEQDTMSDCSTESISDDESLIEINLPDGNHVEDYPEPVFREESKGEEFLWDFLPESVFKQTGLIELLSEINEEDNMIEIDIARGSIKCSNLGIMT